MHRPSSLVRATVAPLAGALGLLLAACGAGGAAGPAAPPNAPTTAPPAATTARAAASPASGGSPAAAPKDMKKLTFMAGFKPQANISFVGPYVAQEKGFYAEQGLDVEIKHSAGGGEHTKLLAGKQIQVATQTGASLLKDLTAENPVPFVSLALLTQTGDTELVTLKSSGITDPKQFEGKTVGYKVFPSFEYLGILQAAGVDRSKLQEVSVGFDPRVLTEGKVDVLPVFKSNEPFLLRQLGFEVNEFAPEDYGVESLGQLWITHRDLLQEDPELFRRFVKASLKGLEDARENPEEAVDIVMKYAPNENREHMTYMLTTELAGATTDLTRQQGLGAQTQEQWQQFQDALAGFGLIDRTVDPALYFDDQFQKAAYENGKLLWP